jgi:N5-(cytidine 5'-diphosphoramidyl)-L-glutamine hydrolase
MLDENYRVRHRMKAVAITQRVAVVPAYGERRDCLDQAWTKFLAACGLVPVLLPNVPEAALALCEGLGIGGLILTGGNDLAVLEGHVAQCLVIRIDGERKEVNSYHRFAALDSRPPLEVWAVADDGVVKAIRHSAEPITGIMWHPERTVPFSPGDVVLFRQVFGVA